MALSNGESAAALFALGGNIVVWLKIIYDNNKRSKNGNGKTKQCDYHYDIASRLAANETANSGLAEQLENIRRENREDHRQVFEDIKKLTISMASYGANIPNKEVIK